MDSAFAIAVATVEQHKDKVRLFIHLYPSFFLCIPQFCLSRILTFSHSLLQLVELAQELKSKELLTYDDVVRHLGARPAGAAVPESSAISLESVPVDDADAESKSKSESK